MIDVLYKWYNGLHRYIPLFVLEYLHHMSSNILPILTNEDTSRGMDHSNTTVRQVEYNNYLPNMIGFLSVFLLLHT